MIMKRHVDGCGVMMLMLTEGHIVLC